MSGTPIYVHDLELPGMLHGRIARPPSYEARLAGCDEAEVRALPGVIMVVRDGSFLGVVAEREEQAVRALIRLKRVARWDEGRDPAYERDTGLIGREVSAPNGSVRKHQMKSPNDNVQLGFRELKQWQPLAEQTSRSQPLSIGLSGSAVICKSAQ